MNKNYIKIKRSLFYLITAIIIVSPNLVSAEGWSLDSLTSFGLPNSTIKNIIEKLLMWILGIFGFLGVIGFAISGIMYLVSAGDDNRMETAKKAMQYSIIGVIVGISGLVVIAAVNAFLKGTGDI